MRNAHYQYRPIVNKLAMAKSRKYNRKPLWQSTYIIILRLRCLDIAMIKFLDESRSQWRIKVEGPGYMKLSLIGQKH